MCARGGGHRALLIDCRKIAWFGSHRRVWLARNNIQPQKRTVAVNVTGDPFAPWTEAVAFCTPIRLPSVHVTLEVPSAPVAPVSALRSPPPLDVFHSTWAPSTGLPNQI